MSPFDDSMFPDTAVFSPAGTPPEKRGDVAASGPAAGAGAGRSLRCYVERPAVDGSRAEGHDAPEGESRWNVFTPADPGAALDSYVVWDGVTLVARAASRLSAVAWWTECVRVS